MVTSGSSRWMRLWLWQSCCLLAAVAKPPCPAQAPCLCTDLRMKCVQLEGSEQLHYLSSVPYFAPNSPETRWTYVFHEFLIRDQAMTNLTLAFNWGALSVRRLEVTSSLVRHLRPDAFRGFTGVKSLNLSHNLLASVGAEDLRDLTSLDELVLHNNLIKTLHPEALARNGLLTMLYLSHNLLSEIPTGVKRLSYLTHLYLQYNNISRVPRRAFSGLRRLIILDLGALRTDLTIDSEAFCGLEGGLAALYLRGNILRGLDLCTLGQARSLQGLNLTGSFFPCSCHAISFLDRADWERRYGFAPHYVDYEPGVLAGCDVSCPSHPPQCPDYCAALEPSLLREASVEKPAGGADAVAERPPSMTNHRRLAAAAASGTVEIGGSSASGLFASRTTCCGSGPVLLSASLALLGRLLH